jgi:hypothetical protein
MKVWIAVVLVFMSSIDPIIHNHQYAATYGIPANCNANGVGAHRR